MKKILVASLTLALGAAPALAKKPAPAPAATATLAAKSGSTVAGTATFTVGADKKLTVEIKVDHAPPGVHAVHLHVTGDCSSPDGNSAGGHWNPTTDQHGQFGAAHFHLGDIGNMTVAADGTGSVTLTTDKWTAGDGANTDVVGHAVVVHGGVDDFKTQPTGNAGPRIACGVVTASAKLEKKGK